MEKAIETKEQLLLALEGLGGKAREWDNHDAIDWVLNDPRTRQFIRDILAEAVKHGWSVELPNGYVVSIKDTDMGLEEGALEIAVMDRKGRAIREIPEAGLDGIVKVKSLAEVFALTEKIAELQPLEKEREIDVHELAKDASMELAMVQYNLGALYLEMNNLQLQNDDIPPELWRNGLMSDLSEMIQYTEEQEKELMDISKLLPAGWDALEAHPTVIGDADRVIADLNRLRDKVDDTATRIQTMLERRMDMDALRKWSQGLLEERILLQIQYRANMMAEYAKQRLDKVLEKCKEAVKEAEKRREEERAEKEEEKERE